MTDLKDLYQQVILDHGRQPRNCRVIEGATHQAAGYNPLCGDRMEFFLKCEEGVIRDVSFRGSGCAISTAAASLLTESLIGRKVEDVRKLFDRFHEMVTGQSTRAPDPEELGKLTVFAGVSEFPARVKCATLAAHTLRAALDQDSKEVSTE